MKNILMKKPGYLFIVPLIMLIFSCENQNETSNQENQGNDTFTSQSLSGYSKGLQELVKSGKGAFRGINLGMHASEVKRAEEGSQLDEEGKDSLNYMINFGELENAEIKYILDSDGKVSKIEANIYPKSKESQDSLYLQFDKYFTNKYGSSISAGPNSLKWENKTEDLFILMEKKDTQKIHDINITFSYLTRQTAVLKR